MSSLDSKTRRLAVTFVAEDPGNEWGAITRETWQRWILQTPVISAGEKQLVAIDVADYLHVRFGTRLALIFHGAHLAIDDSTGKLGLLYCDHGRDENQVDLSLSERVDGAIAVLSDLAARLEKDLSVWRFDRQRVHVDRLDRLARRQPSGAASGRPMGQKQVAQ